MLDAAAVAHREAAPASRHRPMSPPPLQPPRDRRRCAPSAQSRWIAGGVGRAARLARTTRPPSCGRRCCAAASGRRPAGPRRALRRARLRRPRRRRVRGWLQQRSAAVSRRAARRRRRRPDHRLLRAADRGEPHARAPASRCRCTARRPTWPRASPTGRAQQIDIRCPRHSAALARPRDRVRRRPARRAGAADPGLGPPADRRADGRARFVRAAFAGHNDQPYRSVGRWLVEQGELTLEQASWPAIKAWARANPPRVRRDAVDATRAIVFFREEPLPDPSVGPRGAQGVPLTPGRSIAVDQRVDPVRHAGVARHHRAAVRHATAPRRCTLVVAQDTGSAITGARARRLLLGLGRRRRGTGRAHEAAAAHVGAGTAGVKVFAASCDKPAPRHSKAEGAP